MALVGDQGCPLNVEGTLVEPRVFFAENRFWASEGFLQRRETVQLEISLNSNLACRGELFSDPIVAPARRVNDEQGIAGDDRVESPTALGQMCDFHPLRSLKYRFSSRTMRFSTLA